MKSANPGVVESTSVTTRLIKPGRLRGEIHVPPSKSAMQRALFAASLCAPEAGETILRNPADAADAWAARRVIEALGAVVISIEKAGVVSEWRVRGGNVPQAAGATPDSSTPTTINCGEAGFTLRCAIALAARFSGEFAITGEGSLKNRPVPDVAAVLASLGASSRVREQGRLPFFVRGPLIGGKAEVDGSLTSQFLSGLLLVLPTCPEDSELVVRNLVSAPYVEMTLQTVRQFGVEIEASEDLSLFRVKGRQKYCPLQYEVESDWSSASVLMALAAVRGSVTFHGLALNSLQADRQILEVVKNAGASVSAIGTAIHVESAPLRAFEFDATNCPDLFPALVVLATGCEGTSKILGASRLVAKESNRAQVLSEQGRALGIDISWAGDCLSVGGRSIPGGSLQGELLRGGAADAHNDHRMAMAFAALGAISEIGVQITGAECVAKSYPDFFEDLTRIMTEV